MEMYKQPINVWVIEVVSGQFTRSKSMVPNSSHLVDYYQPNGILNTFAKAHTYLLSIFIYVHINRTGLTTGHILTNCFACGVCYICFRFRVSGRIKGRGAYGHSFTAVDRIILANPLESYLGDIPEVSHLQQSQASDRHSPSLSSVAMETEQWGKLVQGQFQTQCSFLWTKHGIIWEELNQIHDNTGVPELCTGSLGF